jgi:putative transposase
MGIHRNRRPPFFPIREPVFITWRLHSSLPLGRGFPRTSPASSQAFDTLDRQLDEGRTGPLHLRQPLRAEMAVQAIHYNACILAHFELDAFVVMANHVHLLLTPYVPVARLTRSLKAVIARRANQMLGFSGTTTPFWEADSYGQVVHDRKEFERIRAYIEQNPVRAGLVRAAADFRWCSASEAAGKGSYRAVR